MMNNTKNGDRDDSRREQGFNSNFFQRFFRLQHIIFPGFFSLPIGLFGLLLLFSLLGNHSNFTLLLFMTIIHVSFCRGVYHLCCWSDPEPILSGPGREELAWLCRKDTEECWDYHCDCCGQGFENVHITNPQFVMATITDQSSSSPVLHRHSLLPT